MSEWHRHTWNRGVQASTDFSNADKVALNFCAVYATYGTEDTFGVRQSTIAANTALHQKSVAKAIRRALALGWLELVAERQRGSRGKSDKYRLVIPDQVQADPAGTPPPEVGSEPLPTSEESMEQLAPKYGADGSKVGSETEAPTSGNDAPLGYVLRFLEEGAASPPPAPLLDHLGQPRCRKHFGVENPPDCPPCGLERERKEALDRFKAERIEAERRAIRAAIDSCPNKCDDAGRLDDLSDCPLHPNFRQKRDVA
ncbi:hypothetical protein [Mycobacteroides abscessus]